MTNAPHASVVPVVIDVVDVVVVTVKVVVVGDAQPLPPHASQQLDAVPTHALPCFGALQRPCLIEHDVFPDADVRQQVTNPVRPQVDRAAHRTTAPRHFRLWSSPFAA